MGRNCFSLTITPSLHLPIHISFRRGVLRIFLHGHVQRDIRHFGVASDGGVFHQAGEIQLAQFAVLFDAERGAALVLDGLLFERAHAEPSRFRVIDATRPLNDVRADLARIVATL